jgi:hypothetical protein
MIKQEAGNPQLTAGHEVLSGIRNDVGLWIANKGFVEQLEGREETSSEPYDLRGGCDYTNQATHGRIEVLADKGVKILATIETPFGKNESLHQGDPHEIIAGKIRRINSDPEKGGLLEFSRWYGKLSLTGLVDPKTGDPRVKLWLWNQ